MDGSHNLLSSGIVDEAKLKQEVVDATLNLMPVHVGLPADPYPYLLEMEGHLRTCMNDNNVLGMFGVGGLARQRLLK